jgi:diaminopimelate epimerase
MHFVKYEGAGNDFILIELEEPSHLDFCQIARSLCDRHTGIGADGILLVLPSRVANCRMRIWNSDGSEASMCGNGVRCVIDFLLAKQEELSEVSVETGRGVLVGRKWEEGILVNMGAPVLSNAALQLSEGICFVVNTGVPHAVLFVDDLAAVPIEERGRQIRFHSQFAPEGVNVNFAWITPEGNVSVRTYERGVEGETLACGTGAAAAAYAALQTKNLPSPIRVLTRTSFQNQNYEHQLSFHFPSNAAGDCEIEMIGPARRVFEGVIENLIPSRHASI